MNVLAILATVYSAFFAEPMIQRANVRIPCNYDLAQEEGIAFDLSVDDISEFSNIYFYFCFDGGERWLRLKPLRYDGKPEHIYVRKSELEGTDGKPKDWKLDHVSLVCTRAGLKGSKLSVDNLQLIKKERRWMSSLSDPHHLNGYKTFEEAVKELAAAGFTDLIIGPDRADRFPQLGDPLKVCHKYGIKCHAYFIVFSRPWERKYGDNFLDPADPKSQQMALDAIKSYVERGFDGIGLDYIRYSYDQKENAKFGGVKPEVITAFVKRVRELTNSLRPGIELTASVFENPAIAYTVGQDWGTWLDKGYVDYIKPMIYYTANDTFYLSIIDQIKKQVPKSWKKVIPMIGIREWPKLGEGYDRMRYQHERDLIRACGYESFAVYQLEPRIIKAVK